jgi:hypothetical protein
VPSWRQAAGKLRGDRKLRILGAGGPGRVPDRARGPWAWERRPRTGTLAISASNCRWATCALSQCHSDTPSNLCRPSGQCADTALKGGRCGDCWARRWRGLCGRRPYRVLSAILPRTCVRALSAREVKPIGSRGGQRLPTRAVHRTTSRQSGQSSARRLRAAEGKDESGKAS